MCELDRDEPYYESTQARTQKIQGVDEVKGIRDKAVAMAAWRWRLARRVIGSTTNFALIFRTRGCRPCALPARWQMNPWKFG
jgi:hypothetical protein